MKLTTTFIGMGLAKSAMLALAVALGDMHHIPLGIAQADDALSPRTLEKRDAFSCYGDGANITDCRTALEQLKPLGDQKFEVYSGVCLNWSQDTCNVRFCAQPLVSDTVNRTASWIYNWANNSLMTCVEDGQYAIMGDSVNLNGNGGTYRLHLEQATRTHT